MPALPIAPVAPTGPGRDFGTTTSAVTGPGGSSRAWATNWVLARDFDKFTGGRWRERFRPGDYPFDFESCDWWLDHRGRHPRFWRYVMHAACHWLVNFNLRLTQLSEPRRPWRILTSDAHSTVWDGDRTLFDLTFLALWVTPQVWVHLVGGSELALGRRLAEARDSFGRCQSVNDSDVRISS